MGKKKFMREVATEENPERDAVLAEVFKDLDDSWDIVQKIFGERATPDHAVQVANMIGDRLIDEDDEDPVDE
jgi:hypothetical protein